MKNLTQQNYCDLEKSVAITFAEGGEVNIVKMALKQHCIQSVSYKGGNSMAMYDWNNNGNNNDIPDNFNEYQIYKNCTNNNTIPGISTNTSGSSFLIVFLVACVVSLFNEIFGALILVRYGLVKLWGG